MSIDEIIKFARSQGYETAEPLQQWKGYDVYEPVYKKNTTSLIGPPLIILVKDDSIRMSTVDEAYEQMNA